MPSERFWEMDSAKLSELKRLILNKHRRWFQSSRVRCPCVKVSASWFLESTNLIRIFGSTLILSNNQSSATRWFLETCLKLALLLLIIISITASLSSKMHSFVPSCEHFAFEETKSTCDNSKEFCVSDCFFSAALVEDGFPRSGLSFCFYINLDVIPQLSNPKDQAQEFHPCAILHKKRIVSASAELCDTHVCFLHIQLIGTHVWLPNTRNVPPDVDCESSKSPENLNLEIIPIYLVVQYFPHENIVCIHLCNECKRSNAPNVCHRLWSILWSHVQLCWLTIEYPFYQFVPDLDISEQFVNILLTIFPQISILLLWIDGHQCMELTLCIIVQWFVCQFAISFHTLFGRTFHVVGPRRNMWILRAW